MLYSEDYSTRSEEQARDTGSQHGTVLFVCLSILLSLSLSLSIPLSLSLCLLPFCFSPFPPLLPDQPHLYVCLSLSPPPFSLWSTEEIPCQREAPAERSFRDSHVPEQFAGLLHGSSPACESPDNPFQLYGKVRKFSAPEPVPAHRHGNLLQAPSLGAPLPRADSEASGLKVARQPKPQVVYRTIFHTRVNQDQAERSSPPAGARHVRNGEPAGGTGPAGTSFEERACTLGRMRSVPKNVLDLQLSRNFSKSDSNLISVSPIEEELRPGRAQPNLTNSSTAEKLERTPSFTAEWEEVRDARRDGVRCANY